MPVGSLAMVYFLPFADFRFTLYAIATACLTGLPAFTSAPTFFRNADLLDDFTRGITYVLAFWQSEQKRETL